MPAVTEHGDGVSRDGAGAPGEISRAGATEEHHRKVLGNYFLHEARQLRARPLTPALCEEILVAGQNVIRLGAAEQAELRGGNVITDEDREWQLNRGAANGYFLILKDGDMEVVAYAAMHEQVQEESFPAKELIEGTFMENEVRPLAIIYSIVVDPSKVRREEIPEIRAALAFECVRRLSEDHELIVADIEHLRTPDGKDTGRPNPADVTAFGAAGLKPSGRHTEFDTEDNDENPIHVVAEHFVFEKQS